MAMKSNFKRSWVTCLFFIGVFGIIPSIGQETLPRPLPQRGWSTPSPSGWVSPVAPSSIIDIFGGLEAAGQGSAQSSHGSSITATGSGSSINGWKAIDNPKDSYIFPRDP